MSLYRSRIISLWYRIMSHNTHHIVVKTYRYSPTSLSNKLLEAAPPDNSLAAATLGYQARVCIENHWVLYLSFENIKAKASAHKLKAECVRGSSGGDTYRLFWMQIFGATTLAAPLRMKKLKWSDGQSLFTHTTAEEDKHQLTSITSTSAIQSDQVQSLTCRGLLGGLTGHFKVRKSSMPLICKKKKKEEF